MRPITYTIVALVSSLLVACGKPVDVAGRQAYWQEHLEKRFETEQTPDHLIAWLRQEGVVFADYNKQGKVFAVLEILPGNGIEFTEHQLMMVAEVVAPDTLGPFYLFAQNSKTALQLPPDKGQ